MNNSSFYSPLKMPDGSTLYGAAAMNKRVSNAGGLDAFAHKIAFLAVSQVLVSSSGSSNNKKVKR